MKADVKERWVAALRSGKYKQGVGFLTAEDSFCCLGVLCDLALLDGVISDVTVDADKAVVYYDDEAGLPPESVMLWAGLDDANPVVTFLGKRICLSELNDGVGLDDPQPFSIVAAEIEAQL